MKRFAEPGVAAAFEAYPAALRKRLLALRALVFDVAARTEGVGPLTETLKWGQPSYLTEATRSGSTVRIDRLKKGNGYAIYFHCQSGLVPAFRALYPDAFRFDGKRALLFEPGERLPVRALRHCIGLALTHHLRKK
ncbi:MAG TPA: DUF1801 domain-containing protein [Reyranella sp.]|jgi:hypothetical protein